jgi:hypothetical protein
MFKAEAQFNPGSLNLRWQANLKYLTCSHRMLKRIAAITFIFICTAAWAILGSTIYYRTSVPTRTLRDSVSNTWGPRSRSRRPRRTANA